MCSDSSSAVKFSMMKIRLLFRFARTLRNAADDLEPRHSRGSISRITRARTLAEWHGTGNWWTAVIPEPGSFGKATTHNGDEVPRKPGSYIRSSLLIRYLYRRQTLILWTIAQQIVAKSVNLRVNRARPRPADSADRRLYPLQQTGHYGRSASFGGYLVLYRPSLSSQISLRRSLRSSRDPSHCSRPQQFPRSASGN
jgi:hypothetical protein